MLSQVHSSHQSVTEPSAPGTLACRPEGLVGRPAVPLGRVEVRKVLFVSPDTHTLASRAESPRALCRDGAMT